MTPKKASTNPKVAFRLDPKIVQKINGLDIPVSSLAGKVRYAMMRGLEVLEAEKAARTK
jgi:hypothetical protein